MRRNGRIPITDPMTYGRKSQVGAGHEIVKTGTAGSQGKRPFLKTRLLPPSE
jgi:hypothetical protein